MYTSGFITSLVTSLLIFLVLILLYVWLSRKPGNAFVYYPSKILKNQAPPTSPGPLTWIREAYSASEEEFVQHAGLDATVYMVFLSTCLWIFTYTALYCLPVLLPLSGTDDEFAVDERNGKSTNFTNFDKAAMGNITRGSSRLWAFLIGAYWLTIVTLFMMWRGYRHVLALRTQYLSSPKASPEQYAVLVRDIPPPASGTVKSEVDSFFRALHPDTYESCIVVSKLDKVNKLYTKLETFQKKLAHAQAVFAEKNVRPSHKTGTLGLIGPKVDSIDYYEEQIEKLTPLWKEEQRQTWANSQQGAAIAFFNSRAAATSAAQVMHSEYANKWTTSAAPEPREVVWGNLPIPFVQRLVRQFIVYGIVLLTILFYMIPIAFISAIISLESLQAKLPFLKPVIKLAAVNAILQAFLPQIVLIIFLMLLPSLLLKLSQLEGIPAQSHLVRAAAGKFFYFNVFNVFLGVTIVGTLFKSLKGLFDDPKSIVDLLSASLPAQATFFITFVALKFFVGYGLQLSRIVPLIIYHLKRKYLCKTEEEVKEAWAPSPFGYSTCVPGDMLIFTITICYSIIAPVILPFAMIYFGLGWLVMRNQALNVAVPAYESGGRMWPHMHSRILAALFLSQLTMLGYFGVKKFAFAVLLIPLLLATLVFAYLCNKFYYPSFSLAPLVAARSDVKDALSVRAIEEAYTPACLLSSSTADSTVRDPEKLE